MCKSSVAACFELQHHVGCQRTSAMVLLLDTLCASALRNHKPSFQLRNVKESFGRTRSPHLLCYGLQTLVFTTEVSARPGSQPFQACSVTHIWQQTRWGRQGQPAFGQSRAWLQLSQSPDYCRSLCLHPISAAVAGHCCPLQQVQNL